MLSSNPRGFIWNTEKRIFSGIKTVQNNDSVCSHRSWDYQKKALPVPGNESWTDFFNLKKKNTFFSKRQTTSTEYSGLGFWKSLQCREQLSRNASLGSICLIRKLREAGIQVPHFNECFPVCRGTSHIYIMSVNSHNSQLHCMCGKNWDHYLEGLWLRDIRLRDRGRLQPPPSDCPHGLVYKRLLRLSAYRECGSKRWTDSFLTVWGLCRAAVFWETLAHALWALCNSQRSHLPPQWSHLMSPHGHEVFTLQSPLFSTRPIPQHPHALAVLRSLPTHFNIAKQMAKWQGLNLQPLPSSLAGCPGNYDLLWVESRSWRLSPICNYQHISAGLFDVWARFSINRNAAVSTWIMVGINGLPK